jgi:hypothetical protein
MFKLNDQYSTELKINDIQFPLNGSTFDSLFIIENVNHYLPSINMIMRDPTGLFGDKFYIGNGSKVSIKIARSDEENVDEDVFLMKGVPATNQGRGLVESKLYGVLDFPNYMYQVPKKAINGNSSEAIEEIAADCGLQAEVDKTNDKMAWLHNRKPYCMWAHNIADYGWVDDSSCMSLAVSCNKKLMYKNIDKLATANATAKLSMNDKEDWILVSEYKILNRSSQLNQIMGYGLKVLQDGLTESTENLKNTVTKMTSNLEIGNDIKSKISHVRVQQMPFDCGNTHKNYARALHQNRRIRALYAIDIQILVQYVTGINLYDVVELELIDPIRYERNEAFSTKYIVTGKTRAIGGSRYCEKLTLTTQGRQTSLVEQV